MAYRIAMVFIFLASLVNAQELSRQEYIDKYKSIAIQEMREHGIPASITMGQGILESQNGNSQLTRESNNHFGIKCHSDWSGKKTFHDDDEKNECFRKYSSAKQSFKDHSLFLKKKRYEELFSYKITDYKSWAKGLKKAGYATNPEYANLLIKIIEDNQLYLLDADGSAINNKFLSGFTTGWPNVLGHTFIYKNNENKFFLNLHLQSSFEGLSGSFSGGQLFTDGIGFGIQIASMRENNDEWKISYGVTTHFFIPIKKQILNLKLSVDADDLNSFTPSVSIGLLR